MNARPRKTDKLLDRDGRFFARIVVPKDLRPFVGKTELRTALGPDRRQANRLLPAALADLHARLAAAERQRSAQSGKPTLFPRFPLTPQQIAGRVYSENLASDQAWRESEFSKQYTQQSIDWDEARRFRDGYSGKLSDDELQQLVGLDVSRFRARGNHEAAFATDDWRRIAQGICYARAEAFVRQEERNEGNFNGEPERSILLHVEPDPAPEAAPVSLAGLLDRYLKQGEVDGRESGARKRWTPVFENLKQHLKHDDASRVTKADLIAWLDARAEDLSPKTIADVYLASVRAVLTWAAQNRLGDGRVFEFIRLSKSPGCFASRPICFSSCRARRGATRKRCSNPSSRSLCAHGWTHGSGLTPACCFRRKSAPAASMSSSSWTIF